MQEVLSVSNDVAAELATVGDGVLEALRDRYAGAAETAAPAKTTTAPKAKAATKATKTTSKAAAPKAAATAKKAPAKKAAKP